MPCIILLSFLYKANRISEAPPLKTINTQKKINRLLISIPKRFGIFSVVAWLSPAPGGINADSVPASLFAIAFPRNQVTIRREENFKGESFETILKPIGDRQSSPIV